MELDSRKRKNATYGFKVSLNKNGTGYSIENGDVKDLTSDCYTEFIDEVKKNITKNAIMNWISLILLLCCVVNKAFIVLFFASLALKSYIYFFQKVNVNYECDDYGQDHLENINKLMKIMMGNNKLWQINNFKFNSDTKTNGGAAKSVSSMPIKLVKKAPYFIKTNVKCYKIKLKKETIYFLPDKILVVHKKNVAAIDLKSVDFYTGSTKFIEKGKVPSDAVVIGHTWKYVNKSGKPDKRYKDNKKIPLCKYGRIAIESPQGLNLLFQCSNIERLIDFRNLLINKLDKTCGDI